MDPLLIFFGFGVGVMVGMTGMGGGSLMTPLLVLLFGVKPTLAVGTDIAYQAVTKTVGGYKHFKLKTVNFGAVLWLALGSVPGTILGVQVIHAMQKRWGDDVETFTLIALAGVLAFVGIFTLVRSVFYPNVLPHISFNRSTLPWERVSNPLTPAERQALETRAENRSETEKELADSPKLKTPWLALLLFDQDELVEKQLSAGNPTVTEAEFTPGKVSEPKACTLHGDGDTWTLAPRR